MKKFILSLMLTMMAATAQADSWAYYGGLQLGINNTQDKKDLSVYQTKGNPGQTFALLPQTTSSSEPAYGLFFGTRYHINQFFLGAELGVQLQNASPVQNFTKDSSTFTNDLQESLGPSATLALMPGIQLGNKWDVYGKLGYVTTQFQTKASNPGNFGPQGNFNQWINGLSLGLGAEYHFNPRWSLGLEYNYVNYSPFSITGNDDQNIDGGAWGKVTANYKLTSSSLLLKTSYWF